MHIFSVVFLAKCVLLLSKQGQCYDNDDYEHHATRILNGRQASKHSHPYKVYINISDSSGQVAWYCGGSLINPQWVLTAAHCLTGATKADITLGAHDLTQQEPSQLIVTSHDIFSHPRFIEGKKGHDIGLIKLPYPVPLSREIKPIRMPSRREARQSLVGREVKIMGWGLVTGHNEARRASAYLVEGDTHIISNANCRQHFPTLNYMDLCLSGQRSEKTCMGDSGGPVVIGDVQIGVVSYGHIWCDAGIPSVATNVGRYLDWMADVMRRYGNSYRRNKITV